MTSRPMPKKIHASRSLPRNRKYRQQNIEEGEIETEAFDGTIRLKLDEKEKKTEIHINQYSSVPEPLSLIKTNLILYICLLLIIFEEII